MIRKRVLKRSRQFQVVKSKLFRNFLRNHRLHIFILVAFLFYLLTLPQLIMRVIPCVENIRDQSYTWSECNIGLVLDRFVTLALAGFGFGVFILFSNTKLKKSGFRPILLSAVIMATMTVASFYLYINQAEKAINRAPIILDSLLE